VIRPAFFRMRQIVASETVNWYCSARCQAIVLEPASHPCRDSCSFSLMISSAVAAGIAAG
jgi:hypothetical protein